MTTLPFDQQPIPAGPGRDKYLDDALATVNRLMAERRVGDVLAERGREAAESWAMARLMVEVESGANDRQVASVVRGLLEGLKLL